MLKPDAVSKNLIGKILKRVEKAGFKIIAAKLITITEEQAKKLYQEHEGNEFYQGLIDFALEGPAMITVVQGNNSIEELRKLVGATDPKKAWVGTIRGDLAKEQELPRNMVHASDSTQSALREISIFFSETEIFA